MLACKTGDLKLFQQILYEHELFFMKSGVFLLVEKIKLVVYRNLLKKLYL